MTHLSQNERLKLAQEMRKEYPSGTRVMLISMDDEYRKMKKGEEGTVLKVDDMGTIHISWDAGFKLGVIPMVDEIQKI